MPAGNRLIHARDVEKLLAGKHSEDIFVPECKIGQSWTSRSCRRFDAWVMKRSYSPFCCLGYEIKVSRRDFVQDEKMVEYLPYCHQFYIVAPAGVAEKDEIPEEAGLIRVSKNGKKLYTVKKAPFRKVDIPDSIFKYIIMSRCKVTNWSHQYTKPREEIYREFLEGKLTRQRTGYLVSRRVSEMVKRYEYERDDALRKLSSMEEAKKAYEDAGLPFSELNRFNMRRNIQAALSGVPEGLMDTIEVLESGLSNLKEHMVKMEKTFKPDNKK